MTAHLEWGLNPLPEGVEVAWGCRAIINQDGLVDLLGDRMGAVGDQERRTKLLEELTERAGTKPWEEAKRLLVNRELSTRESRKVTLFEDDTIIVVASPNSSAGYLYVAAYYKADVKAESTEGAS